MTEVIITHDDRIESAIAEALERIPLASLVRDRVVAVKPNETWASADDSDRNHPAGHSSCRSSARPNV